MTGAYRQVVHGPRAVTAATRADGSVLVRSTSALEPYPRKLSERLLAHAQAHPQRVFLAMRDARLEWRSVTYAAALEAVRRIAASLIARDLSAERPIAILSGASIEHALLALAAMHVGIPFAPISPAYSLSSHDLAKLRHVLALLTPGLVFAQNGLQFARALEEAVGVDAEVVVHEAPPAARAATPFEALTGVHPSPACDAASAAVGPDTVAKILFTSGSTGFPKGVINTQRMLCCNQQMFVQSLPMLAAQPPVLVDWLPWHHTSGGNQILGLIVYHGGTLYIDDGRPLPRGIEGTVRNLREISPTLYFTVPRGYAELIPHLRRDRALRERFFARVAMFYYSGAPLADGIVAQLDEIALEACGERIPMFCGYGATETGPFALCANWFTERSGLAGLPVPGAELKLVPRGAKYEALLRGPSVTPGYWRQPELTCAAFDEEGYFRSGDALAWVDPSRVEAGLAFDGRLAEDFKLSTGTWVSTGALRARLIGAARPLIIDAVIAGEGRDEVAALIFPDLTACRSCAGEGAATLAIPGLLSHPSVRERFQSALDRIALESTGSSTYIARALVLEEPASIAAGEITDKGSLNQRAVLGHRVGLLAELYSDSPPPRVYRAAPPNRPI
jgi:feruloyl-CoA synthase